MKKKSSFNGWKIILIVLFTSFMLKLISGQYNINLNGLFHSKPKVYKPDVPLNKELIESFLKRNKNNSN
tara:strand:+ start:233 stop:439 length:207 start_codon:yes stop_codon:yes gene_type:complete